MIPFQRCGYFYIDEIEGDKVVLRVDGEFEESVDEVADYDSVCLWVIVQIYHDLRYGDKCGYYDSYEAAQAAIEELSKETQLLLKKYDNYLRKERISFKNKEDFIEGLNALPAVRTTEVYVVNSYDNPPDYTSRDQLIEYGYDAALFKKKNKEIWTDAQVVEAIISLTKDGYEKWLEKEKNNDYLIESDIKLYAQEEYDRYTLVANLFIPPLKKQVDELMEFIDHKENIELEIPDNEPFFEELAKTEILNRKLSKLKFHTDSWGATTSHGYITFQVKNESLVQHLREGMVIYG